MEGAGADRTNGARDATQNLGEGGLNRTSLGRSRSLRSVGQAMRFSLFQSSENLIHTFADLSVTSMPAARSCWTRFRIVIVAGHRGNNLQPEIRRRMSSGRVHPEYLDANDGELRLVRVWTAQELR